MAVETLGRNPRLVPLRWCGTPIEGFTVGKDIEEGKQSWELKTKENVVDEAYHKFPVISRTKAAVLMA